MNGKELVILQVEDDPAHAEITRRNMEMARVANRVFHVGDGQSALDYLFHTGRYSDPSDAPRPDLVLLDLRLPKVDGIEVLRTIKAEPSLKNIPVVILTTSEAEQDMAGAYAEGAGSYLVKPVDFEKFINLMEIFGYYWLAWNRYPHE
jgi:CheY-like chemotaxis protein